MAIPEQFIEELVSRTDMVDLVSGYVRLNKKGNNYWGLCPFHSEKTASFSVSPDKQICYCFGCHKGGGAINFLMELENLSFVDAVRQLAQRAGMEVPETGADARIKEKREQLLEINKEAARWFHAQLYQPQGAQALDYLRRRGLSQSTLTNFGLGFAPDSWDDLLNALAAKGYDKRQILEAGLAVSNDKGRIYNRFRNRVMFPIIDVRGSVIGFGGRVMDDSKPKYLNSPEGLVYNKSRNLFALNIAKKSKLGRIILTEGYMDTIALHQAGFDNAVASLGTALTPDHALLLSRYTKEAVIAYDGDGAGVAAAHRAIPILEKAGLKVRVLRMRGAKDPDEFIKAYGKDAFAKLLDESENHIEYRLEQLKAKFDLTDDAQRVEFLHEVTGLIASLPNAVEREVYGGRAAQAAGISAQALSQEVQKELRRRYSKEKKRQERHDLAPAANAQPEKRELRYANVRSALAEEGVLRLVLLEPQLLDEAQGLNGADFSAPLLGKVYDLLRQRHLDGRSVQIGALAAVLTPEEMSHLARITDKPENIRHGRQALADYIAVIRMEHMKGQTASDDDLLRAAQEKYKTKKAYGGE
ncbi:MAG: DNA primase [Oscillospiraceae bacterium]|nr:DNA primase [Oscillospiraceae bacterium]